MVTRERRPGQGPGRGRQGPAREARLQGPAPHGAAGRGLHRVVPAAEEEGRRLRHPRVGSRTSTTRSRCSSRRSRARTSRRTAATTTWRSSRTRRSTRRWTTPRSSRASERYQAWGEIDKMITAQAPAVPFIWDNTNLIHSKNVNAVGNAYIQLVRPHVHLDQVRGTERTTDDAGRPRTRGAGRVVRSGKLAWAPTSPDGCCGPCCCCGSSAASRSSSSTSCRAPTRRCSARAAAPSRRSSRASATRSASTSRCTSSTGTT